MLPAVTGRFAVGSAAGPVSGSAPVLPRPVVGDAPVASTASSRLGDAASPLATAPLPGSSHRHVPPGQSQPPVAGAAAEVAGEADTSLRACDDVLEPDEHAASSSDVA